MIRPLLGTPKQKPYLYSPGRKLEERRSPFEGNYSVQKTYIILALEVH
jgi:hypothetical protein